MEMRIGEGVIDVPPSETKHRFERHWQTTRLVGAFAAMEVGERVSKEDLAARIDVSIESLEKRVRSAKHIALHEHHVMIETIRGFGFERLPQDAADIPAGKYLSGARRKARRASEVITHGVTEWEKIERTKKNELFAMQAQASVIARATGVRVTKKLAAAADGNERLDFGRTVELLKK